MKTFRSRTRTLALALPLAGLCVAGCWDDDDDDPVLGGNGDGVRAQAVAQMTGYTDSSITGTVMFSQDDDSLVVSGTFSGLAPGAAYGIHVHQIGDCSTPEASGPHFHQDEPHGNPFDTADAKHRGDLPNVQADANGVGQLSFATDDISLFAGDDNVAGRAVVLHAQRDDYVSQPSGNSGERIACGVIDLMDDGGDGGTDTTGTGGNGGSDTTGTGGTDTTGTGTGGTGTGPGGTTGIPGYP